MIMSGPSEISNATAKNWSQQGVWQKKIVAGGVDRKKHIHPTIKSYYQILLSN